jgi:subtilisin family serine protease
VPGSYVVVLGGAPGTAQAARTTSAISRATASGITVERRYAHALNGFSARLTPTQLAVLRDDPDVAYVVPDQIVRADATQNPAPSWGLDRIDQRTGLNGQYQWTLSGSGVTAYVIDTGIRATHRDFGLRVLAGMTAINDGNGTNDCNGHGTHVAGTIGGTTYGVAKKVRLVPVRVLDCNGAGSTSTVVAGIDWVTAQHYGPSVANMSLGGSANPAVDAALANSISSGVSYVVSAGNNNGDACALSPARVPAAITVGATTSADSRDTGYSNYGTCVDIFAPGTGITSDWGSSDTATKTISGTSMASPHVTGVVALYLQAYPTDSPAAVASWVTYVATIGVLSNIGPGSPNCLLYAPGVSKLST